MIPLEDPTGSRRWETSPPGYDAMEIGWWEEFSDVEDTYCWANTPSIQRFLRGHYIRKIARSVPQGGTALEFGCGAGWLPLRLLEEGVGQVYGTDFSPAQIELANRHSAEQGYADRARYLLLKDGLSDLRGSLPSVDVLILHGVLHHMTNQEIRAVISDFCANLAAPAATIWIMEPVLYPELLEPTRVMRITAQLIDRLIFLPVSGERLGFRRVTTRERAVREKIQRSQVGVPPRGPSPKEHSFMPGEIERLLSPYVDVISTVPVMCFAWRASRNLLLLRLSHRYIGALVMWPYLWLVRLVERKILENLSCYGSGAYGVFELKRCRVRSPVGASW